MLLKMWLTFNQPSIFYHCMLQHISSAPFIAAKVCCIIVHDLNNISGYSSLAFFILPLVRKIRVVSISSVSSGDLVFLFSSKSFFLVCPDLDSVAAKSPTQLFETSCLISSLIVATPYL
jgi:hypothetical protein